MADYILTDQDNLPRSAVDQWNANIAAIKVVKDIEAEGRDATPEEQAVLARYSGFGNSAFSQAFSNRPTNKAWGERGRELKALVTPEEHRSIRESRLNAFYTTPEVIQSMWGGLMEMGAGDLKNPVVLEPSAGSGRFLGLQPPEMAKRSRRIATELDYLTGSITKYAYPDTQVHVAGYEDVHIPDDYVDIAISNVPFGNYPVHDAEYGDQPMTRSVHNYFFGKTIDKLKPGGVAAFITTHYTLDSPQAKPFREKIAEEADFLGAVRLPNNAFPDTQVVTDIIYLRKRDPSDKHPVDRSWVETQKVSLPTAYIRAYGRFGPETGTDPEEYSVNRYFIDNPDKVLGTQDGTGSMRGEKEYTVRSEYRSDSTQAQEQLEKATEGIVRRAPKLRTKDNNARPSEDVQLKRTRDAELASRPSEGQYRRVGDSGLERVTGGEWQPVDVAEKEAERIRGMLSVRDETRRLMGLEMSGDADEEEIARQREAASQSYRDFVAGYGELNAPANVRAISGDPDSNFLRGLEVSKDDEWVGADIFSRRTFSPAVEYSAQTPEEALAISLNEKGRVDMDYIAEVLGRPKPEVIQALVSSGQVFLDPETRTFQRSAQYLSGAVKEKLRFAQEAAQTNPAYRVNVEALEKVQPERVSAGDIYLSLSSSWLPQDVVNEGLAHVLSNGDDYNRELYPRTPGQPRKLVEFSPETGNWGPAQGMVGRRSSLNDSWGTGEVPAQKIIEYAVTNRPIKVETKNRYDAQGNKLVGEEEEKKRYDEIASRAAQQKIDEIKAEFYEWALADPERVSRLEDVYNETRNISIPRQYDASHMTFPGMSAMWQRQLLPHQREAIARVVQDGNVMLAHEVGFGKTASMVGAAMERKRLGLTQKPMFVLPNATAAQFAADFREMYPGARLLFEENINEDNRKTFLERVRNNDWDSVLVTYTQFERMPVSMPTLDTYEQMSLDQLEAGLEAARDEGNEYREKQVQNLIKKTRTAFRKKRDKAQALFDAGAPAFETLGVDHVFVDEADNFKNLGFFTGLDKDIKGLNPTTESMRGWDMFMKTQALQGRMGRIRNARGEDLRGGVVFATGSSISNSLAELWTMMRYLNLDEMEKRGLDTFDAWAGDYGRMEGSIEVRASGEYKPTTRFSKFANLPELSKQWQEVADIRVQSELPVMLERQPRLVDQDGNPKRINVQSPRTATTDAYMQHIGMRATELDADTKRDNMLKLSGDARKASLDVRFAPRFKESKLPWPPPGSDVEANPQGKIPLLVQNVAEVYHAETPDKGTQLIFLDMGTPKGTKDKDTENTSKGGDEDDELALDAEEQAQLAETYNMIRRSLEAKGIPAKEVAFIHDVKKNEQKKRLFKRVKEGQVRVVIGSTNKLGVGVNVQDRLAAIHHVDVPWRPRDVEQREGRIIRSGNKVYGPQFDDNTGEMIDKGRGVKIYKYVQQGSFDEFMWQAVEKKAAGIKAITKRHVTARESDDLDEFVMSAAEARALASGDPRAVELVTLETQLAGMKLDRAAYESQRTNAQAQIGTLTNRIKVLEDQLPNYARDSEIAASVKDASFVASDAEGRAFEKRADADKEFRAQLAKTPFGDLRELGTYKGLKIYGSNRDTGYQVVVESTGTGQKYYSGSFDNPATANVITRVENIINGMGDAHDKKKEQLASAQNSLRAYKEQMDKPYDQLKEMTDLERRVRQLRRDVQGVEASEDEGEAVTISREGLVQEDIEQASEEDMIEAEGRVVSQIMERRRQDRSYKTPEGEAFDALVSEALQDILQERRQQEEAGIDDQVDPELVAEVPDSIPDEQQAAAAAAIDEAFDIDPDRVNEIIGEVQQPNLKPAETKDVVERVAERIQEESEEDGEEGRVTVVSMADVGAMLQEEMRDEGVEEGVIPQYADTDYAGDGDDEEDAYIDVDGAMVPEGEPDPPEPDFVPLVKVSSSRAGIIDRMAELVAEKAEVQNANANSPQNLDIEINKQIKQVATDSLLKYRQDKDFIEFYNALSSDSSIMEEIREKVHGNLEGEEAAEAAEVAVSADTAEEETLSDRIRNFGDTGFVDPDDYETLMDTGFDGDIAEADSLEDVEAMQDQDYKGDALETLLGLRDDYQEAERRLAEYRSGSAAGQVANQRNISDTEDLLDDFVAESARAYRELYPDASKEDFAAFMQETRQEQPPEPMTEEVIKELEVYESAPTAGVSEYQPMAEEAKAELEQYESEPSYTYEYRPMTEEDIDRLRQYESSGTSSPPQGRRIGQRGKSAVWEGFQGFSGRVELPIDANVAKGDYILFRTHTGRPEVWRITSDEFGTGKTDNEEGVRYWGMGAGLRDMAGTKVHEQLLAKYQGELATSSRQERKPAATSGVADPWEYTGMEVEPYFSDIDTDYVSTKGKASDIRRAEEKDQRKAANGQRAEELNEALASGGTVMIQTAGGALEIPPRQYEEETLPFRVGSDGNLQVLARWRKGKPVYDTLLGYRASVHGLEAPAMSEAETVTSDESQENEVKDFLRRLESVREEIPSKGKGVRVKGTNVRHLRNILTDALEDDAATREKLGFAAQTFRDSFADDEAAISLADDIDAYLAQRDTASISETDEEPYYYRETDLNTGETVTHVEADSPEEAAEILEDIGPSEADDSPSVTRVDIDVETGETEVTITESPEDQKADDLDAAEAEVLEVVSDGVVTPAEAEEAKSEAGRILAEVAQDTPDDPAPRRAYDSEEDIEATIRELCDDPEKMRELLDRAKADAAEAETEREVAGGQRDGDRDGRVVSESAASAAADVLAQARDNAPSKPRKAPRKARESDINLLRAAVETCDVNDPSGPVAIEAMKFLDTRRKKSGIAGLKAHLASHAGRTATAGIAPAQGKRGRRGKKGKDRDWMEEAGKAGNGGPATVSGTASKTVLMK